MEVITEIKSQCEGVTSTAVWVKMFVSFVNIVIVNETLHSDIQRKFCVNIMLSGLMRKGREKLAGCSYHDAGARRAELS